MKNSAQGFRTVASSQVLSEETEQRLFIYFVCGLISKSTQPCEFELSEAVSGNLYQTIDPASVRLQIQAILIVCCIGIFHSQSLTFLCCARMESTSTYCIRSAHQTKFKCLKFINISVNTHSRGLIAKWTLSCGHLSLCERRERGCNKTQKTEVSEGALTVNVPNLQR